MVLHLAVSFLGEGPFLPSLHNEPQKSEYATTAEDYKAMKSIVKAPITNGENIQQCCSSRSGQTAGITPGI